MTEAHNVEGTTGDEDQNETSSTDQYHRGDHYTTIGVEDVLEVIEANDEGTILLRYGHSTREIDISDAPEKYDIEVDHTGDVILFKNPDSGVVLRRATRDHVIRVPNTVTVPAIDSVHEGDDEDQEPVTDGGQTMEDEDDEDEWIDLTVKKDDIAEYCCFHALEGDEYDLCSEIRDNDVDWISEICPENVNHIESYDDGNIIAWGEFEIAVPIEHIPATRHSPPETRTRSRKVMFEAKAKLGEWGDGYLRIE